MCMDRAFSAGGGFSSLVLIVPCADSSALSPELFESEAAIKEDCLPCMPHACVPEGQGHRRARHNMDLPLTVKGKELAIGACGSARQKHRHGKQQRSTRHRAHRAAYVCVALFY